jgi:hypothetical protein
LAEPLVPVRLRRSCTSGTLDSVTPLKNCIDAASQATLLCNFVNRGAFYSEKEK